MLGERNGRLQYFVGGMGITTGFQYNCQVRTQFPGVPAAHRNYRKKVRVYGEDDMCPDCRLGDLQSTLDEVDYRLNPDTEALGWARVADAISMETTPIEVSGDEEDDMQEES